MDESAKLTLRGPAVHRIIDACSGTWGMWFGANASGSVAPLALVVGDRVRAYLGHEVVVVEVPEPLRRDRSLRRLFVVGAGRPTAYITLSTMPNDWDVDPRGAIVLAGFGSWTEGGDFTCPRYVDTELVAWSAITGAILRRDLLMATPLSIRFDHGPEPSVAEVIAEVHPDTDGTTERPGVRLYRWSTRSDLPTSRVRRS